MRLRAFANNRTLGISEPVQGTPMTLPNREYLNDINELTIRNRGAAAPSMGRWVMSK